MIRQDRTKQNIVTALILSLCIVFIFSGGQANANLNQFLGFNTAKVEVNGVMLNEDEVPPIIVNNRTMIPIGQAAELLNAYTEWDNGRKLAMIKKPVVNMTIINRNKTSLEVNPTFRAGSTHSFQVATQVAKVPISKELKTRFVVVDSSNSTIYTGNPVTIDTSQYNGSFIGNLNVANLRLGSRGEYTLKLQMEDPNDSSRYITIGEYVMVAN
ncbi:stalk domain-containing protein [Bacillus horti]|uniref:Copper amine oxidase-like N-terminal domain-containing protein n=1 Tax=Caldalkalibacillus horti TaxID=77523 RepID=A0ABT9W3Q6_9BACI|nr:stalk domain-containing protein [Bacillus horti]MDQ0167866.1 hypothetical protein [Bacillus horti]